MSNSAGQDNAYARCKACNTRFYPRWRKDIKQFEDLCWTCGSVAMYTAKTDPVLYGTGTESTLVNHGRWQQDKEENDAFIEEFKKNHVGVSGDLWKEDEYLQYGEGAMGDSVSNLFDSYGAEE